MYLRAERYVSGFRPGTVDQALFKKIVGELGLSDFAAEDSPALTVKVNVAYWRKAWPIHEWFVENTQGGVDECLPYSVSREKLAELRDLCKILLDERELVIAAGGNLSVLSARANDLLGSSSMSLSSDPQESDEWYWLMLDDTVTQIDKVLTAPKGVYFEYQSSW